MGSRFFRSQDVHLFVQIVVEHQIVRHPDPVRSSALAILASDTRIANLWGFIGWCSE